jgi:hypothetical protein
VSAARRILLALLLASSGAAQAADLYGGYSVLRLDGHNAQGAALALSVPLGGALRLGAEASRQTGLVQAEDLGEWALLAGPVFAPRRGSRLAPFLHAKAGLVRSRRQVEVFGVTIGATGVCDGACPSETGFAAELGGGLDIRLGQRLGLRLPQVDYRFVRLASDDARRLRFSAGLLLRLGR